MKAQMMKYTEAIGLALVIAAVMGGWLRSSLEPPNDADKACALRLEPGGGEVALWNRHCSHLAEMRTQRRLTLAGNVPAEYGQAGNSQGISTTSSAGADLVAAMGRPCDDAD